MPKPQEVAQITVNGMNFRDWESVQVKLVEGESNNSFRLTVTEGMPLAKNFAGLQIRPGDHCSITLGGVLAITGYVETRQVAYTGEQHGIEIIGVSYTKALADGAAMTKTGEFRDKSWKQIADQVVKPVGINVVPKTGLPGKPFRRASIPPGMSKYDFLEMLARQRGITMGTDKEGNLTARVQWTGGGESLIEGINILEGNEVMTIKQGGGPNDVVGQEGAYDVRDNWGAKVAHGAKGTSKSNINTGGKGVHAPNRQLAEHPGDKDDRQSRSKFESQVRGQEQLQVTIVVQGWLKSSGGLWQPGEKVHVKSPMLIVDEVLDLVSATFTQDNKSGTRTTLELKRPGDDEDGKKGEGQYDVRPDGTSGTSDGAGKTEGLDRTPGTPD
jgi:prophage tail gpP-like protein